VANSLGFGKDLARWEPGRDRSRKKSKITRKITIRKRIKSRINIKSRMPR
jgi:hypothetical protein